MENGSVKILEGLTSGSEAQLFSDALAVQIGKTGTGIAALLSAVTSVYYFMCSLGLLGPAKRSVFAIGVFILAAIGAYFLYQKSQSFVAIDDQRPIIAISPKALEYDVRRDGWSLPWSSIEKIALDVSTLNKKQSVEQKSYEIHVVVKDKQASGITWKYEPGDDNDVAESKKLLQSSGYLVINPEPLGLGHEFLQKALEKYRAGL